MPEATPTEVDCDTLQFPVILTDVQIKQLLLIYRIVLTSKYNIQLSMKTKRILYDRLLDDIKNTHQLVPILRDFFQV